MQLPTDRQTTFKDNLFRINMDDLIRETKKQAPPKPPPKRVAWLSYLIIAALVGMFFMKPARETKPAAAIPAPAAVATPTPVRRAELMPMPVTPSNPPRAQLLHIRPIGTTENDQMPDGRILTTLYKGELPSVANLPRSGAQLGDMWFTRNDGHCWVLAPAVAGSQTVGWVDP